jgi:hypothetical protein
MSCGRPGCRCGEAPSSSSTTEGGKAAGWHECGHDHGSAAGCCHDSTEMERERSADACVEPAGADT